MDEITTALLTTENRASSATQAGNAPAHQLQVRAASQYLNDLAALTDANVSLQVKIAALLPEFRSSFDVIGTETCV